MGVGEFAGLSTLAVGDHLDRGRERLVMVASLGLVSLSSIIALGGTLATFADRLRRARAGRVEPHRRRTHLDQPSGRLSLAGPVVRVVRDSWALALLLGAPIVAALINQFGWRGPFVALAVAAAVAALVVAWKLPNDGPRLRVTTGDVQRPTRRSWMRCPIPTSTSIRTAR